MFRSREKKPFVSAASAGDSVCRNSSTTCSNSGRAFGSGCQQYCITCATTGWHVAGMVGRSPLCTTPTAACSGVYPEYVMSPR